MTSTQNIDARDMTNLCTAVYICYIIGMLMQFHLYSSILGSAIILCVLVFAYVKRKETKGTLFESHFQWMIRSFWIGGAVYLPVATVFVSVFLFLKSDSTLMQQAVLEGEKNTRYLMQLWYEGNAGLITYTFFITVGIFALWWIWRCVHGLWHLRAGRAIPRPASWF